MMLEPRAVARALGDARREGRTWRCRCAPHGKPFQGSARQRVK